MRSLVLCIFVCLIALAFGRPSADQLDPQYFDQNQFSEGFRRYEARGCSDEVNTCMRELHESVNRCEDQWKRQAGTRFQHCIRSDPVVVNASRDFQRPSFKWHKAMDQCLAGTEAPSQQQLESLAIEAAAMSYFGRKKRDTDTATAEDVSNCWRQSRVKRNECTQKAMQCTQFAHCYGEGSEPSGESAKRWYNYIKRMRNETKEKGRTFIMHMGHCLRNEPHTHHAGHHGQHDH